jgi:hypothetical protein
MKKAELEELVILQRGKIENLENGIGALVEESMMLGEDMRGRPFMPEDLEGFTSTEVMNEYNTFVEREVFSLDDYHMSRGKGDTWYVVLPTGKTTVPVEIGDMFEGVMVLRALGLKRLTFQGLMEADVLVTEMADEIRGIREMRDVRILNESKEDER